MWYSLIVMSGAAPSLEEADNILLLHAKEAVMLLQEQLTLTSSLFS